ncbi:MAG: hypothetical protein H6825_05700 [Planctomycetes bacterium]|nr:hypothetical protein [Planctomycetota bacterium]
MKTTSSRSPRQLPATRRAAWISALAAGVTLVAASPLRAQDFRYGLSEFGHVVIDGTLIDKLPSGFDPTDASPEPLQRWWDVAVFGADRYAVRLDGKLYENGTKLYKLPVVTGANWAALAISQDGEQRYVWALRDDGLLARNGEAIGALPHPEGTYFFDVVASGDSAYSLRTDGAVFVDNVQGPVFTFVGGDGSVAGHDDGSDPDTWWARLTLSPVDGDLYALRQDGVIFRGVLPDGDEAGDDLADLVSSSDATAANLTGNMYVAIDVLESGDWVVMRGDGNVYTADNTVTPLVNFAGDPIGNDNVSETFLGLDVVGSDIWALRWDGRLYRGDDPGTALANFPKDRYRALAIGDEPPDLGNIKNGKPAMARYTAYVIEGDTITLPLLANDTDKAQDELQFELLSELPEGATYDPDARTITWEPVVPKGKAKFKIAVDDGVLKKPKRFTQTIKVVPADAIPEKNKSPLYSKIKGVQALVGIALELPILVADADGDEVTVTPVLDKGVFALDVTDAAYDAETGVFSWTPRFEDLGKAYARFLVSDGTKTKKVKISFKVVNPLIFGT